MGYRSSANKNRGNGNEGFSLIEVLIGIAILSIGILAVATLQVTALQGNTAARMSTEGGKWAEDRAEILLDRPFDDPDLTAGDHGPVVEGRYSIRWTVQNTTTGGGMDDFKLINVIVTWSDRGVQKTASVRMARASAI